MEINLRSSAMTEQLKWSNMPFWRSSNHTAILISTVLKSLLHCYTANNKGFSCNMDDAGGYLFPKMR